MRIAVAADHAGFPLYQPVIDALRGLGHEANGINPGNAAQPGDDYPDYAMMIGASVKNGQCERGVLICGSGVGASVAANKIAGIRAGLCHDTYSAHQGVEHDDMNVLCLGARIIGSELALELVRAFAGARYTNEERHRRRVGKVLKIEATQGK